MGKFKPIPKSSIPDDYRDDVAEMVGLIGSNPIGYTDHFDHQAITGGPIQSIGSLFGSDDCRDRFKIILDGLQSSGKSRTTALTRLGKFLRWTGITYAFSGECKNPAKVAAVFSLAESHNDLAEHLMFRILRFAIRKKSGCSNAEAGKTVSAKYGLTDKPKSAGRSSGYVRKDQSDFLDMI